MIAYLKKYFNPQAILTRFFVLLFVIAVIATVNLFVTGQSSNFSQYLVFIIATFGTGAGLLYVSREKLDLQFVQPVNWFISVLIIYLLIHPTEPVWIPMLTIFFLFALKLVRKHLAPIWNPAAFSLLLVYMLTGFRISWWGANLNQKILSSIPLLDIIVPSLLLISLIYVVVRFKKTVYVAAFFMTVMFFVFQRNLAADNSSAATISFLMNALFSSFAFFALVMLPEPKTSPVKMPAQLVFGTLFGWIMYVVVYAGSGLESVFPIPFVMLLLLLNTLVFVAKKFKLA